MDEEETSLQMGSSGGGRIASLCLPKVGDKYCSVEEQTSSGQWTSQTSLELEEHTVKKANLRGMRQREANELASVLTRTAPHMSTLDELSVLLATSENFQGSQMRSLFWKMVPQEDSIIEYKRPEIK
eukprot:108461-Ditylum_brightwellii.AAC.1